MRLRYGALTMSAKHHSITLVLSESLSSDDVQPLIDACMQLRGVTSAHPNIPANLLDTHVGEQRAIRRITNEMAEAFGKLMK
jgi:hypothetical protein